MIDVFIQVKYKKCTKNIVDKNFKFVYARKKHITKNKNCHEIKIFFPTFIISDSWL